MARRWHHAVLTTSALLPLAASALAGPNNASVVGGAATIQGQGTANVVVNQSTQSAIINWQTFNIGAGETTRIYMPNSNSTQLDRVNGGLGPSQILGTLSSDGKVFLVNPDGILFGMGARINVGSLVATTNDITNSDFMAGRYNFSIPGNPNASIVNTGTITAQTGGFAALVAPGVRNTGTIIAKLGTIALASGNAFTLDMYGDNLITLGLTDKITSQVVDVATGQPLKSLVSNTGKLEANGGTVVLTAVAARKIVDSVINNSGVIEANSIGSHKGMIVLGAAAGVPNQKVKVSGRLSATGKRAGTSGGTIQITGDNVKVAHAKIDASGQTGGGTVLIGGDWGGGNPNTSLVSGNASAALQSYAVPNSGTVSIDAATMIDVSATATGNGGKVVVWANQATTFLGTILAKGGSQSGNGGFVETSGGTLTFNGAVNTSAPNGEKGTLLLDPLNATIAAAAGDEVITTSSIENALANGDVVVTTVGTTGSEAGDITVAAGITWATASSLTLAAYRNITINNGVTISNTYNVAVGAGNLNLRADVTGTGVGTVTFLGNSKIDFSRSGGLISIFYNPSVNPPDSVVNSTSYVNPTETYSTHLSGWWAAYMLVNSVGDLQNIQNNLSGDYALGRDIDASPTSSWNSGAGFNPIGNSTTPFIGELNGNNHSIIRLFINSSAQYVGLFGYIDVSASVITNSVHDLTITSANITGNFSGGSGYVGILAGASGIDGVATGASVSNVTVDGAVSGISGGQTTAGGLIGLADEVSTIYRAAANVSVHSDYLAGGLIGDMEHQSTVTESFSLGSVYGTIGAGGLVGLVYDSAVYQSYASGNASVGSNGFAGGLEAENGFNFQTYATGIASGGAGATLSGLVAFSVGTSTYSYAPSEITWGVLPTGFNTSSFNFIQPGPVWGSNSNINNGYPYLLWTQAPSPPPATTFIPALSPPPLGSPPPSSPPVSPPPVSPPPVNPPPPVSPPPVSSPPVSPPPVSPPPPVSWSITPTVPLINENQGIAAFTISNSGGQAQTVYVSTVQNDGFTNNGYYVGLNNQTVTFAAGQKSATIAVTILDKGLISGSETFGIVVQNAPGTSATPNVASTTFTISNNDEVNIPPPALSQINPTQGTLTQTLNTIVSGSTSPVITNSIIAPLGPTPTVPLTNSNSIPDSYLWTGKLGPTSPNELLNTAQPLLALIDKFWSGQQPTQDWTVFAKQMGLSVPEITDLKLAGFQAGLYIGPNGQPVLVFQSTKFQYPSDLVVDALNILYAKLGISSGDLAPYKFAAQLAAQVQKDYPFQKVMLTGFSLGGGMAAYAGAADQIPAVTFDPTGISNNLNSNSSYVLNFQMSSDIAQTGGSLIGTTIVFDQAVAAKATLIGASPTAGLVRHLIEGADVFRYVSSISNLKIIQQSGSIYTVGQ